MPEMRAKMRLAAVEKVGEQEKLVFQAVAASKYPVISLNGGCRGNPTPVVSQESESDLRKQECHRLQHVAATDRCAEALYYSRFQLA